MIARIRNNLGLKLISLATAIMIWSYAVSDRAVSPRRVMAEVVVVGEPPRGLDVEVRSTKVLAEVTGPRAQLDAIGDGSVKAIVDLSTARPGMRALRVSRFVAPPEAPSVTFPPQTRTVEAVVHSTVRKRVKVTADIVAEPPSGKRYSSPRIEPGWADVEGPREAVERVALLMVRPDVKPTGFRGPVAVDPVDREQLTVPGVKIDPPTVFVEVQVLDIAETRVVVVSPDLRGRPPAPFVVTSVSCEPAQVTVSGLPRELASLDAIRTVPISLDSVRGDAVRQVALDLPAGIQVKGGRITVEVTIRVKDVSRSDQ